MTESAWLDTTKAAQALDIAPCTLKRRRDIDGGFLEAGKHYRFKTPASNSAILWDVDSVRELFHERGMQARKDIRTEARAERVIRERQEEGTNG